MILCPDTTYIEFGAGRGKLSHWVQRAAENETNTRFILVDRSNNRNKVDCYHKGDSQGPSFERLFVDIEHLDLSEVASISQSDNNIVGIGKHLCGGATDLSYRCLMEDPAIFSLSTSSIRSIRITSKPQGLAE